MNFCVARILQPLRSLMCCSLYLQDCEIHFAVYCKRTHCGIVVRIFRAPGHSGRCVSGCEGPEAGGTVEGSCFVVD